MDHLPSSSEPEPLGRGIIAVVRTRSAASALTLARGLALTDVAGIEVTMTVPGAVDVISALVSEGVQRVGAGTVRSMDQLMACVDAGARFLVSPHFDPNLVEAAVGYGVPAVPGALTPSEIVHAMACGASAVKLFPVSAVGGTEYVRAVLQPIPDARLVVSGEVLLPEVADYFAAGAWAACIGSSLWRPADVESGNIDAISAYAVRALQQLRDNPRSPCD
jgi:2-dehydro-3-deoxyphosphogluconate aldolase/(4S)-4-hydroxy-2-oxoglutarate aldolase